MIERLFSSQELMDAIRLIFSTYFNAKKTLWSSLTSMIVTDMDKDMLLHRASETIQLWADLTMMYQGDFMVLQALYRDLREMHAPFPTERDNRYFDDLRQMQINLPVFSDVIIF